MLRQQAQRMASAGPRGSPILPPPLVRQVCGRLPAGLQWAAGRSRADQAAAASVPAREPQAGTLQEKTLITHARTEAARFLGYEIVIAHDCQADLRPSLDQRSHRMCVPADATKAKCSRYMRRGKPISRSMLKNEEDYTIINRYQAEYRGIVQYYLLAGTSTD